MRQRSRLDRPVQRSALDLHVEMAPVITLDGAGKPMRAGSDCMPTEGQDEIARGADRGKARLCPRLDQHQHIARGFPQRIHDAGTSVCRQLIQHMAGHHSVMACGSAKAASIASDKVRVEPNGTCKPQRRRTPARIALKQRGTQARLCGCKRKARRAGPRTRIENRTNRPVTQAGANLRPDTRRNRIGGGKSHRKIRHPRHWCQGRRDRNSRSVAV